MSKKTPGRKGGSGKAIVLGMRERGGKTKAINISGIDGNTLHKAIHDNVSHGSTVYTDELWGYRGIGGTSYKHERVNHSAKEYVNGLAHTNGIESVWAVMKRGYNGVYHNWSRKHRTKHINEFTFRINSGNCAIDTMDRMIAVVKGTNSNRLTYFDEVPPLYRVDRADKTISGYRFKADYDKVQIITADEILSGHLFKYPGTLMEEKHKSQLMQKVL